MDFKWSQFVANTALQYTIPPVQENVSFPAHYVFVRIFYLHVSITLFWIDGQDKNLVRFCCDSCFCNILYERVCCF